MFKLWFVFRSYGVEGLRFYICYYVEVVERFVEWVVVYSSLELVIECFLVLVCFCYVDGDEVIWRF